MKIKEIEIKKILNNLSQTVKKIYIVYGFEGTNKTRFIQNLFDYNLTPESTRTWIRDYDLTEENLLIDIKNIIQLNLTEENCTLNKNKLFAIKKAKKEIDELCNFILDKEKSENSKLLWPILNTISSFGLSLGLPLLSLAFFRTTQIIEEFGSWLFYLIICMCFSLIFFALGSTLTYLGIVIKTNKSDKKTKKPKLLIEKYLGKWFSSGMFKNTTNYNLLYSSVKTGTVSQRNIDYIKIINSLNNNLFIPIDIETNFDIKALLNKYKTKEFLPMNSEQEKLKSFEPQTLDFILNTIYKIYGIKINNVIKSNILFLNAVKKFVEVSTTNYQIIKFFNYAKQFTNAIDKEIRIKNNIQNYFLDLLSICIYKMLDPDSYNIFELKLSKNYDFDDIVKNNLLFNSLKIEDILNKNISKFKTDSFVFYINNILYDTELLTKLTNSIASDVEKHILSLDKIIDNNNLTFNIKISDQYNLYTNKDSAIVSTYNLVLEPKENLFDILETINNLNLDNNVDITIIFISNINKILVLEKAMDEFIYAKDIIKYN